VKLEFLMEYSATLRQPVDTVGPGPFGNRRIFTVTGGAFEGPRLRGRVLPSGGDWLLTDASGTARLDVRATLEADDGALIYVQYFGVNRTDSDRPQRPPGEHAEYGDRYFMTTPRFETGAERYAWLNGMVCVAEGKGIPGGVAYRVYSVVNDGAALA